MTIRIVIADDQPLFREGLRTLLSVQGDMEVVGEAANGAEAIELTRELGPDVVLMDLRMPEINGVAATRRIQRECPKSKVLILTTFDDDEFIFDGLRAGAIGYLLKDADSAKLFEAVRAAARGESTLHPLVATKLISEYNRLARGSGSSESENRQAEVSLSQREYEILRELAKGVGNKEIGARLFIAEGTVKNHITNLFAKLGVGSRLAAVTKARELGLIQDP
ncbi:Response regulator transcription factor [Sulfidibacter corallicola]|uniref:Response regulator transcription factor n=1 Tax=Sulfidibacter corallicola TaxID=2818388 RepID=A0A8A4TQS7_SULCO|nr:response regulator transcription factor [Sulfidibacter corallicola]QTD51883.1 response regulator transcription factor [Sulfidibacter corallicola]